MHVAQPSAAPRRFIWDLGDVGAGGPLIPPHVVGSRSGAGRLWTLPSSVRQMHQIAYNS